MKWKIPKEELPILIEESKVRCVAFCGHLKEDTPYEEAWFGILDVYFDPAVGWWESRTGENVKVFKWTYYYEFFEEECVKENEKIHR